MAEIMATSTTLHPISITGIIGGVPTRIGTTPAKTTTAAMALTSVVPMSEFMSDVTSIINFVWMVVQWLVSFAGSCVLIMPIGLLIAMGVERSQGKTKSFFTMPSQDTAGPFIGLSCVPGLVILHFLVGVSIGRGIWTNMLLVVAAYHIVLISLAAIFLLVATVFMVYGALMTALPAVTQTASSGGAPKASDDEAEPLQPDQIELATKAEQQKEVDLEAGQKS